MSVAGELFVCAMEDRISYLFVGSLAAPSRLFIKKTKPFIRGGQVEGRAAKPYRLRQQQPNEFNKYRYCYVPMFAQLSDPYPFATSNMSGCNFQL